MDALIDFVLGHMAPIFLVALGIGTILYACFAKRMAFEGDVAVRQEERKTYEATPEVRKIRNLPWYVSVAVWPLLPYFSLIRCDSANHKPQER